MTQTQAWMLRHIFQHHIGPVLQEEGSRSFLKKALSMSEEEMEAFSEFTGDVGSHLLDRLVDNPYPSAY